MGKRVKKKRLKAVVILFACIVLVSLICVNLFSVWSKMVSINKERKVYEAELVDLDEESKYLETEIEKLQDPDYAARYAREQYLYSKDGEFNIRIN